MRRVFITLLRRVIVVVLVCLTGFLFARSFVFTPEEQAFRGPQLSQPEEPAPSPIDECRIIKECPPGTLQLTLLSESQFSSPVVCFNGARLFEEAKLAKGLNIAILNENSQSIESVHYISLLDGDHDLVQMLPKVANHRILVVATYGDMASKLSSEARHVLATFGSSSLETYSSGMSLLLVGQRGLAASKAFEKVSSLSITNAGRFYPCIGIPMGELSAVTHETAVLHRIDESQKSKLSVVKGRKMDINYGAEMPHCGNTAACERDKIAMSFYSGKNKDDAPRICVNNHFVIDRDLNNAGRGLNLVVIDAKTRQVVRVGHFDTYDQEDTDLIAFLEELTLGEILAVVSFDEAATRLSDIAKKIFYELGSSLIHDIKFRSSWYFVGQKGIDSYSPFEDMFAPSGNDWAKPIDLAACIPSNLNSFKPAKERAVKPQNSARRHFCEKYDGYGDFCRDDRLDIVPTAKALRNRSRSARPVYSIPILLAAGLNRNNVRLCLESLLEQEGINLQNVVVSFDSAYPEIADLAALFHSRSLPIVNSTSYNDLVLDSVSHLMELYPSSPFVIVIEEDVLLSPDFFLLVDGLLEQFQKDASVNALQMFNKHGFERTSSILPAVYRFDNSSFTKAFVLKRTSFEEFIHGKKTECCNSVEEWHLPGISYVPDVSRVSVIESGVVRRGMAETDKRISANKTDGSILGPFSNLEEQSYDSEIKKLIMQSKRIVLREIADCQPGSVLESPIKLLKLLAEQPFTVIFRMTQGSLSHLYRCFHLGKDLSYGSYKGIVRFSMDGHPVLLVSSKSPLFAAVKSVVFFAQSPR